ncbi:MAG: MMPL family transporter [Planctomycetaceae bacterium]|nr:MMPL family transporter [Planctomycetaceae bacterium]
MFFGKLGNLAAKRAPLIAACWMLLLLVSFLAAPEWSTVVQNGEFAFLPSDSPSRLAELGFRTAFPDDMLESSVVLVVRREDGSVDRDNAEFKAGLQNSDKLFITDVLVPELYLLTGLKREADELLSEEIEEQERRSAALTKEQVARQDRLREIVHDIQWFQDPKIGDLLNSEDGKASLIVVQLKTEFLDQANSELVNAIEEFIDRLYRTPVQNPGTATGNNQSSSPTMPAGLDVAISGSATFGRDMIMESQKSAKATEKWTVILVVILLIAIYRAPLLALIPLITVAVSTTVAISLLAIAAEYGWVSLFNGIETYVTVVVYGAGIDYGLFLMARYREELDDGATIEEGVSRTLKTIGPALATSAGTSIFGIGMMMFAEFGKFRQAGYAITCGLFICLIASITLTPAVIRLFGRWAFWPSMMTLHNRGEGGFLVKASWLTRLQRANLMQTGWQRIANLVQQRPGLTWLLSILGMLPFAMIGVIYFSHLSYGLLSELPDDSTSLRGIQAIQSHFPAGEVGPVYVLLEAEGIDFRELSRGPERLIEKLSSSLEADKQRLGIHSVRSLSSPRGNRGSVRLNAAQAIGQRKLARDYYVSKENHSVTRLDLIFENDPFSTSSIAEFRKLRDELPTMLPEELANARLSFKGPTANVSDLKDVTDRDQIRIDLLVLVSVYVVLVALLRKPGICSYLILSVFYSYLATLGITFFVFWAMDPSGFTGMDWKVPLFLFTILIAVGEDYNIFLMTRIDEERKTHGPIRGITVALEKTGGIISSCGIIMAGSFSSLMAGSLLGMDQLGFALALGVLLDTFVVRPIMVPAFMVLLAQGRLGPMSRLAGFQPETVVEREGMASDGFDSSGMVSGRDSSGSMNPIDFDQEKTDAVKHS